MAVLLAPAAVPARPPAPATHWVVDWGEQRCSLATQREEERTRTLIVRTSLGDNSVAELVMVNPGWGRNRVPSIGQHPVEVVLHPSGTRIEARAAVGLQPGVGDFLVVKYLGADFIDRFATSDRIVVERGSGRLAEFAFSGADEAVAALTACNDDLLTSWGIDLPFRESLQRRPTGLPSADSWILPDDYPASAHRAGQTGSVVVRYLVGINGRISDCTVVASSGVEALDRQTCESLTRRARYQPALGPDGNPVAVPLVLTAHWTLR